MNRKLLGEKIIDDLQNIIFDYLLSGEKYYIFGIKCEYNEILSTMKELIDDECMNENIKSSFALKYLNFVIINNTWMDHYLADDLKNYILTKKNKNYIKWWHKIMHTNNEIIVTDKMNDAAMAEYYKYLYEDYDIPSPHYWIKIALNIDNRELIDNFLNTDHNRYTRDYIKNLSSYGYCEALLFIVQSYSMIYDKYLLEKLLESDNLTKKDEKIIKEIYIQNYYFDTKILILAIKNSYIETIKILIENNVAWTEECTRMLIKTRNCEILKYAISKKLFDVNSSSDEIYRALFSEKNNDKYFYNIPTKDNFKQLFPQEIPDASYFKRDKISLSMTTENNNDFYSILLDNNLKVDRDLIDSALRIHEFELMKLMIEKGKNYEHREDFFHYYTIEYGNNETEIDDETEIYDDYEYEDPEIIQPIYDAKQLNELLKFGCKIKINDITNCIRINNFELFKIVFDIKKEMNYFELTNLIKYGSLQHIKYVAEKQKIIENPPRFYEYLKILMERKDNKICQYLYEIYKKDVLLEKNMEDTFIKEYQLFVQSQTLNLSFD